MKKILVYLLMLLPILSIAQEKKTTLMDYEMVNAYFKSKVIKNENVETNAKDFYVSITYRNNEYQQIDDWATIILSNQKELNAFINDFEKALEYSLSKSGSSYNLKGIDYSILVAENGGVALFDSENKRMFWTRGQLKKYIAWLKTIKMPEYDK